MKKTVSCLVISLGLFLVLPLVSCGSVLAAPVPLLKVDEPTDGQIIESYIVNLKYSLKNFSLKDYKQILKNNPNQGHLLIWFDKDRNPESAIKYYKDSPYTLADVSPGKHTIVIELANNDGTVFDPAIAQTIKFETKAPPGSEADPLKASDQPKVAETKTGEAPPQTAGTSWPSQVKYFLAGLVSLLAGFLGIFILKR